MNPDLCKDIFEEPEKYKQWAKEVNETYKETYEGVKALHSEGFSEVAMIRTLTKFKTEQVACLIGEGLTDYDKRILEGVIERHIAGVIYKG